MLGVPTLGAYKPCLVPTGSDWGMLPALQLSLTGKWPPECPPEPLETTCKGAAKTCSGGPPRHPTCCWPLGTSGGSWQGHTQQRSPSVQHYSSSTLTKLSLMFAGQGETIPGPAPGSSGSAREGVLEAERGSRHNQCGLDV